ncbi:hypothetical protein [Streptomyces viridochromogenes]|nr:hypothetical protein [Streptomyces viridochromogenes]
MKVKATALAISPSLLSHWLSGRRLPAPEALRQLYDLAADGVLNSSGTSLSCSFAELEELLHAARKSTCRRCGDGCVCNERDRQRGRVVGGGSLRRSSASAAEREPLGGIEALRRSSGATPQGAGLPEHLTEIPHVDQINLLWSLGTTLNEEEIGATVSALAGAGMPHEMEILLRAAESAGKDSVKITIAFGEAR